MLRLIGFGLRLRRRRAGRPRELVVELWPVCFVNGKLFELLLNLLWLLGSCGERKLSSPFRDKLRVARYEARSGLSANMATFGARACLVAKENFSPRFANFDASLELLGVVASRSSEHNLWSALAVKRPLDNTTSELELRRVTERDFDKQTRLVFVAYKQRVLARVRAY